MKKQLIIIGIVTILITVGLIGCQESQTSNDKVQLVSYTVNTYYNYGTIRVEALGEGFIHNSSYADRAYMINGIIKNIAGEMLNTVVITLNFYDNDNDFLASRTYTIRYLDKSKSDNFQVIYYDSESYFDDIDSVKFEFAIS